MKACVSCGSMYGDDFASCPSCAKKVGRLLSMPLSAPQSLVTVTMKVLKRLHSNWGLDTHASGWRLVDIVCRVVLLFVLLGLVFRSWTAIAEAEAAAHAQLRSHQSFIDECRRQKPEGVDVQQLAINYQRLQVSAAQLVEAETRNARLNVCIMLALIALMASSAIGKYRGHKSHNEIKAAFAFLCSPEGRPFIDQLRSRETEKRGAVQHGVSNPGERVV